MQGSAPRALAWRTELACALGLALLAAAAAAPAALQIGFLSDDWVQLEAARRGGWTDPLVPHHAAPLLTALYKSVSLGWLDVRSWHVLVLAVHALNAVLAWRLARRLAPDRATALAAGVLVALAPGGLEAVLWSAASPFVLLLTAVLLALDRVVAALLEERPLGARDALAVAGLQLAAFAIWDWAIALAPLLAAVVLVHPPRGSRTALLRRLAPGLAPLLGVWVLGLALRVAQGSALGYGWFPIGALRATLLLGVQPAMQLFPQLPKLAIAALAVPCALLLGLGALRCGGVRALLAAFVVLQLPMYLQGAPASRYAYLSIPFLVTALALAARAWLPPRTCAAVFGTLTLLSVWGVAQVSRDWLEADRDARAIGEALVARIAELEPVARVVVVNLPDHLATARTLWPPPLWRNGLTALRPGATKVFTPEHAARFEPDRPHIEPRSAIAERHPNALLLEVRRGGAAYAVVPFDPGAPEPS